VEGEAEGEGDAEAEAARPPELSDEEKAQQKAERDEARHQAREARLAELRDELERLVQDAAESGRQRVRREEEARRTGDHRSQTRKDIEDVGGPDVFGRTALRRMARRAGCKRISSRSFNPLMEAGVVFIEDICRDCIEYTERFNRRTITLEDVCTHLKRHGRTLYGFW
jgi:histone H3/H4